MKKLIILLFLGLISFAAISQERTVTKEARDGYTYYKYSGVSADTLTATNQDTIDFVVRITVHDYISKIIVKSRFDPISGADTTVAITVSGKNFTDGSYTELIASTLSGEVSAANTVKVVTGANTLTTTAFDVPFTNPTAGTADTLEYPALTHTPSDYSYRYFRVRYIIQGDDSVGTGIKLDEVEIKVYTL